MQLWMSSLDIADRTYVFSACSDFLLLKPLNSTCRFKLRLHSLQVDNQLPLSPLPVLFRPQRLGAETDYVLKISVTIQSNGSHDLCVYPYIGVQVKWNM